MEPETIAKSGIDPETGSPLSQKVRSALLKKSNISDNVLNSSILLTRRTENNSKLIVEQSQRISALQGSLSYLQSGIQGLSNGIFSISQLIERDARLEISREKRLNEIERKYLENSVRLGKENEIERGISSSLSDAIVPLETKINNTFSGIGNAIKALLIGFLTIKTIQLISSLKNNDIKKLEQIKDFIANNILSAITSIASIRFGFDTVINSVKSFSKTIGDISQKFIISPLNTVKDKLKDVPGLDRFFKKEESKNDDQQEKNKTDKNSKILDIGNVFGGLKGLTDGITESFSGDGFKEIQKELGLLKFFEELKTITPKDPKIETPGTTPDITPDTPPGTTPGTTPGTPPGTPPGTTPGTPPGTTPDNNQTKIEVVPYPSPEMIEQFEKAWKYKNNSLLRGQIEDAWRKMTPLQRKQAKQWAETTGKDWEQMKLPKIPEESTKNTNTSKITNLNGSSVSQLALNPFNLGNSINQNYIESTLLSSMPSFISSQPPIQGILPSRSNELPPLTEPNPTIIMNESPNQNSQISGSPSLVGTDVPLISSSNSNNFYSMYSQLNYGIIV